MCCRISKLGVAQGSGVTRAWPTRCCCEHTHVCFRKKHSFKVAPKDQRLYGVGRRTAAVSIHMCVWQNHMSTQGLHRGSKRYKSWADQILLRPGAAASTHMWFSEKNPFIHGCTQGSKVVWGRPTNCCGKHTHVCVAESHVNSRLAPRIKKVQEFGRPTAAASIHICVSETASSKLHPRITCYVKSRLHPRAKGYECLADRVLL